MKEGKDNNQLKDHSVEHFDFVVVSCEIWKHLYSWYSADQPVVRFLKRDRTNNKTYVLDLYPGRTNLIGGTGGLSERES